MTEVNMTVYSLSFKQVLLEFKNNKASVPVFVIVHNEKTCCLYESTCHKTEENVAYISYVDGTAPTNVSVLT